MGQKFVFYIPLSPIPISIYATFAPTLYVHASLLGPSSFNDQHALFIQILINNDILIYVKKSLFTLCRFLYSFLSIFVSGDLNIKKKCINKI